jgi:hypothetical protein
MSTNLAPKEPPRRVKFIDITKERPGNWQYVDLDKFETEIRVDETRKWIEKRRRERAREKLRKEAFWAVILGTLAIRVIGALMLSGAMALSLYLHDGTPMFALSPFAALMIICPGHNNIRREMDEYILKVKRSEGHDLSTLDKNSMDRD